MSDSAMNTENVAWTKYARGYYFSLLPSGTWIIRNTLPHVDRAHPKAKWKLFWKPIAGTAVEQRGYFTRLRAARKYVDVAGLRKGTLNP